MSFSQQGVGKILASTFDEVVGGRPRAYPSVSRGHTIFLLGDFGGQHRGQQFDTYSFLALDIDRNSTWASSQKVFRKNILTSKRRMSFKGMNDSKKRAALIPFLKIADGIEGCLIIFAISKFGGSLFDDTEENTYDNDHSGFLSIWKPAVREQLMRIIHLSVFALSGISVPGQDLYWIIDEDAIASNQIQLTQLTNLFGRIWSNYDTHHLGHIKCGTTRSDDGNLILEDLAAVTDLTAGAFSEIATAFVSQSRFPTPKLITPVPTGLSHKSRLIASWLAQENFPLRRHTCLIERRPSTPKLRVTMVRWHSDVRPV